MHAELLGYHADPRPFSDDGQDGVISLFHLAELPEYSASPGLRSPWSRPLMSTFRRMVDIFGRVLIGVGVLLLLFTVYQIWGTSVQESHTQAGLRTQLQQETNNTAIRNALPQGSGPDTRCRPDLPWLHHARTLPLRAARSGTSGSQ